MINKGIMSSNTPEWATPFWLFDVLHEIFHFTLDPCATHENAKCAKHYTQEDDGLRQSWKGEKVFMNPPYGREITRWVKKSLAQYMENGVCTVALLPARTDTNWFHGYVYHYSKLLFLKGRLKFGDGNGSAPFPSMIAVYGGSNKEFSTLLMKFA